MTPNIISTITTLLLLLTLNTVLGNVAVCVHFKGPLNFIGKEVVGFQLWNGDGTEASRYRTIYNAQKTQLETYTWNVGLKFMNDQGQTRVTSIYITSICSPSPGEMDFSNICPGDSTEGEMYYGCKDTDNTGYCASNYATHVEYCKRQFDMGTDSIKCVS